MNVTTASIVQNFKIGQWLVDPVDSTIRHKQTIKLDHKVMRLLCYLVDNRERMVTRDEILDAVWHGQVVADDVLNVAISNLRKSLGDDTRQPKYIKTVPRQGYQIVAAVNAPGSDRTRLKKMVIPAVLLVLFAVLFWQFPASRSQAKTKVAVLPFEYFAADPSDRYLADGLTEAVINQLAQEPQLRVTSRTSVMQYRNQQPSMAEIGEQLGVSWVLEGSVQLEQDQIQVTAQLIEVATDEHLWSETYNRERSGLLAIQNDMAKQIAARFVDQPVPNTNSPDPVAYNHYLKGRYHQHQFDLEPAEHHFQQAVDLAADYALAHAGLAQVYFLRAFGAQQQARTFIKQAAGHAATAYRLDPDHAYTNLNRALAYMYAEQNYSAADQAFARAFRLNHQDTMIQEWYIGFLLTTKQFGYAQTLIEHMREVSPLSYNKTSQYLTLYYAQHFEEALAEVKAISPYMSGKGFFSYASAWIYLAQGDVEQLHRLAPEFLASFKLSQTDIETFQQLLNSEGLVAAIRHLLDLKGDELGHFEQAELLAWQGDQAAAIAILKEMVSNNELRAYKIHIEPAFQSLHEHPDFMALLQQLKLDSI